jgi:hypothetical protein
MSPVLIFTPFFSKYSLRAVFPDDGGPKIHKCFYFPWFINLGKGYSKGLATPLMSFRFFCSLSRFSVSI